jgi:hypothetical protein
MNRDPLPLATAAAPSSPLDRNRPARQPVDRIGRPWDTARTLTASGFGPVTARQRAPSVPNRLFPNHSNAIDRVSLLT